jgi:hypothetical protein
VAVARNMEATLSVPVFRVARRIKTDRYARARRASHVHCLASRLRRGPAGSECACACGPSEDGVRVRARRGAVDASLLAGGAASSACSFARPMEIETRSQYAQVCVECLLFCPAQVECSSARLGVWRC